MSWFDAAGFANLAKSALKEAQKTIDKALDIKDEEQKTTQPLTDDAAKFFETWGLKNDKENVKQQQADEKTITSQSQPGTSSIWGSFTGSFFESPKFGEIEKTEKILGTIKQSTSLQDNYEEQLHISHISFSTSTPNNLSKGSLSIKSNEDDLKVSDTAISSSFNEEINASVPIIIESISCIKNIESSSTDGNENNLLNKISDERNQNNINNFEEEIENRVDTKTTTELIIKIDKNSCEGDDTISNQTNSDCTTTPESISHSISDSVSPSTIGPKGNSESVEILPDSSVTSPSSVEIISDWKSDYSPYLSPTEVKNLESPSGAERSESITPCVEESYSQQFSGKDRLESSFSDISPYESPLEETNSSKNDLVVANINNINPFISNSGTCVKDSITPDSVEVIPDVDETDETSLAEDSYTSASETTIMTIMETLHQFDQSKNILELSDNNLKMHESCPDGRQILKKLSSESPLNLSLDSIKEKHNLHLNLAPVTIQPPRKLENLDDFMMKKQDINPLNQIRNSTIEPADMDNCMEKEETQKSDILEGNDQYLLLTDSSCEGTLIESSSEDNATLIGTTEPNIVETPLTASSYVKNMLADAMVEKGESIEMPRENSPISSESRSDLVKIGSDQTSGHTSGDELETTTSSDIEIISSPNGDSSSTQSRQSPAKLQLIKGADLLTKTLKTRGHSRELSEISIGSDDTNLEIEKLLKRIQEMTEILEARESKLIDVSRMNMELLEQNSGLKKQLDNFEKHAEQHQNLNQITDEYTQRLSALERKFQQAIRDRDSLRKNLEQLKLEAASRLSSQEISTINAEKDEIIKELRDEGEKLSKQQLQHSNIIKKLRIKEKENDAIIKSQKEQIDEQSSELERLKRSLYAKEEVERSQIEAVHTLTAKTKKQEKEILLLQEKLDTVVQKMEAYKKSLEAAKMELTETKKNLIDTEEELKQAVENAGESCQLSAQVEDLKLKLRQAEEIRVKKEEFFKQESTELLARLEAAEARSEQLSESVSVATKPLLRQLEQLQANFIQKTNSFMKQEKLLSEKNIDLQAKVENLIQVDLSLKEDNINLKSKVAQLESRINSKESDRIKLEELCECLKQQNQKLLEDNKRYQQIIETMEQTSTNQMKELKREINSLENKLAVEKAATDAEKRKNQYMLDQQQSIDEELRLSPTLSIGRESISSASSAWPTFNDSVFDGNTGRYPVMYESMRTGSSSTSMIENLQAQLKQRDGEIQHLQWELSRRNVERDALNTELATLTLKAEELNNKLVKVQNLNDSLNEIQTRYDALLQMYGEKVEENQELRLDLEDVKEMYKTQIDQLLKRDIE
ncbi:TATA element modulatory factor-like [Prorops nasuta]|uniref:TATA element modulatory factor-like n=1 Tax=Prorops nasuta TaxID=863751 RepID=UPI0034CD190D